MVPLLPICVFHQGICFEINQILMCSDIDMVIFGVAGQNNIQDSPPTTESLYMLAKHLEKVAVKNSVEVFITAKVLLPQFAYFANDDRFLSLK
jgi:hypothetical protein